MTILSKLKKLKSEIKTSLVADPGIYAERKFHPRRPRLQRGPGGPGAGSVQVAF